MGHRGGGYREDGPWGVGCWAGEMAAVSLLLVPRQVTHRGVDSPPGVCAAPAWRGRLSELVHPCGHQWEEVCALDSRGVPATLHPGWEIWGRSFLLFVHNVGTKNLRCHWHTRGLYLWAQVI